MSIGLVVDDAIAQPDDGGHRQVTAQQLFYLRLRQMRIAVAIQQALLRHQQGALAVSVDGAAFHHQRRTIPVAVFDFRNFSRDQVVGIPGKIHSSPDSAPGIELPVDGAAPAGSIDDKGRAHIAHPRVIAGQLHQAHAGVDLRPGEFELRSGHAHGDWFKRGDGFCDGGKCLLCRARAVTPVVEAFRPQHPGAGMRLELGRHVVAVGERCAGEQARHGASLSEKARRSGAAAAP